MRVELRRLMAALAGATLAGIGAGAGIVNAKAPPPPTGCLPTACTPGTTVGLTNSKGQPVAAAAGLYAWGMATAPDGSVLVGDYWNYRIVHYEDDETATTPPAEATPYVYSQTTEGYGPDASEAPFGICVDRSGGPFEGYTYETEGSLYDVNQYDPSGNWVTSWGTTQAVNSAPFQYPSQCTVGPTGLVYISNQWATPNASLAGIVVLDPVRYHATGSDGSTTSGSDVISAADADLTSADVGAYVYGAGIPAGTTIASVTSATQAVLSAAAKATATNTAFIVGMTIESPPKPNAFIQPRGLAFDSAGNLWVDDEGHKRIEIFYASSGLNLDAIAQKTIAAPPCSPSVPSCTSTTFDMRGLAIDTTNQLAFTANGQGCVVQEFNANPGSSSYGSFITNFNGVPAGGSNCGTGNGQFEDGARGIAVDGEGNVWVGDLGDVRAEVFTESGQFLWAAPIPPAPAPTGGFNGPRGVAFDGVGDMYVTDMYNERIEEFTSNGSGGYTFDQAWGMRGDGPGQFNYPRLMCWDPQTPLRSGGLTGALIVANTDSGMVVAWNPSANPPAVVWSSSTGTPPVGTLADPYGVACDPSTGDVYATNSNGNDLAVFSSAGTQLGTMQATTGKLGFTQGIWVDSDGSVWVDNASSGNVYHFSSWAAGGAELGTPIDVNKSIPGAGVYGIAGDSGYLYVALATANQVAEYTRAGTLVGTFGGAGSKITQTRTPQGMAFGPGGDLYVVDEGSNRVAQWVVP